MESKIILVNGMAVIDSILVKKDILISNGKIKKIGDKISERSTKNAKKVDCKGKIILPGLIDGHVHFREPGLTQKEDFLTGSKAAAAGGITTIIDMPNTKPATITVKDLNAKRKLAASKCIVNYGFHFGSSADNLSEIKKAKNVASTKIFMGHSTGNMKIDDDKKLGEIFKVSRMVSVHAEGKNVEKAVNLAKKAKKKLYLAHISSENEVNFLKKNKTATVFMEVTPHHLYFTTKKSNPFLDVKPSIKAKKDAMALWYALNHGIVDTIGSDHAPHTIKEKKSKNPPSGMPGEETLLPLMLDAVSKQRMSLRNLVKMCCYNPATIFGIKNKGFIKEGYDADIVVVDMDISRKVDDSKLFTKCKWSAFNNKILKGWPVMTIVNGNIVFQDGKVSDKVKGKEVKFN